MNEAIKLAIEKGGYKNHIVTDDLGAKSWVEQVVVLDPLFWQALAKALGWGRGKSEDGADSVTVIFLGRGEGPYPIWKWQAHQYFDLVLTGGDTEKFWKELIR